ncbi:MAG TPA: DNA-binding transcriptional regulator [Gammaproteobacteria bacterium]|nr:DNA-binding transcriptional regulator [Gammaproteobacteria bacterium]
MTTKRKQKSRILAEMHKTAVDLNRLGFIDKRRMIDLDLLCGAQVLSLSARQIRALRKELQVSQAVFAAILNTSVSTVQKWEIGEKKPSGPSLKLLNIIERKGLEAVT